MSKVATTTDMDDGGEGGAELVARATLEHPAHATMNRYVAPAGPVNSSNRGGGPHGALAGAGLRGYRDILPLGSGRLACALSP